MVLSFFNGSYYCFQDKCGLFFWRSHGHDALWHMAVASISFTKFPFIMPTFSGAELIGYNYLLDILLLLLQRINPSQGLIPRRLRRYAFIIDA